MIYKHNIINNVIMVYCFVEEKSNYDACLTIILKDNYASIHGFLSKVKMEYENITDLWKYIKNIVDVDYLLIKILPKYLKVYKAILPVISSKKIKTFNGYDCELLKIDLKNEIRGLQ